MRLPRGAGAFLVVLFALTLTPEAITAGSSSPSYVLHQSATSAGGAPISSTSYVLGSSAAQDSTVGTSSSPSFVLQSGFWSFAGSGLVPVLLTVTQNPVDPTHVDLAWSGNNPPYLVYQATDCASVTSFYFDTTATNDYPDVAPPAASLVCYQVFATAPGPLVPPAN